MDKAFLEARSSELSLNSPPSLDVPYVCQALSHRHQRVSKHALLCYPHLALQYRRSVRKKHESSKKLVGENFETDLHMGLSNSEVLYETKEEILSLQERMHELNLSLPNGRRHQPSWSDPQEKRRLSDLVSPRSRSTRSQDMQQRQIVQLPTLGIHLRAKKPNRTRIDSHTQKEEFPLQQFQSPGSTDSISKDDAKSALMDSPSHLSSSYLSSSSISSSSSPLGRSSSPTVSQLPSLYESRVEDKNLVRSSSLRSPRHSYPRSETRKKSDSPRDLSQSSVTTKSVRPGTSSTRQFSNSSPVESEPFLMYLKWKQEKTTTRSNTDRL